MNKLILVIVCVLAVSTVALAKGSNLQDNIKNFGQNNKDNPFNHGNNGSGNNNHNNNNNNQNHDSWDWNCDGPNGNPLNNHWIDDHQFNWDNPLHDFNQNDLPKCDGDYDFEHDCNHNPNPTPPAPAVPAPGAIVLSSLGTALVGYLRRRNG